MKYSEDSKESAKFLRKAIPLMVAHNIPPHPINYTLWYNYVAQKIPPLNSAIDSQLSGSGKIDESFGEKLYFKYIVGEDIEKHRVAVENFTKMTSKLLTQVDQSTEESDKFQDSLDQNLNQLNEAQSLTDASKVIEEIVTTTSSIQVANRRFNESLHKAHQEIDSLKEELASLKQHAYHDPLTQLNNRFSFNQDLETSIASAGSTVLVLIDIDHFKSFNDQYGHQMGDQVLQVLAKLLKKSCPDNASPARYGGEEFAIVLTNFELEEATSLCESIRKKLENIKVKTRNSEDILGRITASFGLALYTAEESMDELINRADQALYMAKNNGRNRVEVATV